VSDDGDGNVLEELLDLYEDAKLPLEEVMPRYSSVNRGKRGKRDEDIDGGCGF
jgi:hypothetical protein